MKYQIHTDHMVLKVLVRLDWSRQRQQLQVQSTNEYDQGKIIMQERCPVDPADTPETLAARVQALERELLPLAITRIREGQIRP